MGHDNYTYNKANSYNPNNHQSNYGSDKARDAIYVRDDTDIDEIKEFIRRRTESPTVVNDTTIWNFSSYKVKTDALETAVTSKLHHDRYYIPYQVTGSWGFMFALLPEVIQQAEILVYDVKNGRYKAYRNFMHDISREQRDAFTQDLARRVAEIDSL